MRMNDRACVRAEKQKRNAEDGEEKRAEDAV
jgi:hypothetical protein